MFGSFSGVLVGVVLSWLLIVVLLCSGVVMVGFRGGVLGVMVRSCRVRCGVVVVGFVCGGAR